MVNIHTFLSDKAAKLKHIISKNKKSLENKDTSRAQKPEALKDFNPDGESLAPLSKDTVQLSFLDTASTEFLDSKTDLIQSGELLTKDDMLIIRDYTRNSDVFLMNSNNKAKLRKILSKFKTKKDTIVYRGDRGCGMFKEIPLKTTGLQEKIKDANEQRQDETKAINFYGYSTTYNKNIEELELMNMGADMSLYAYIKDKEELTLSDCMIMMPYLDSGLRNIVLSELEGVQVEDTRFKSTTLEKSFAKRWIDDPKQTDKPSIYSAINLKKGIEGIYCKGGQYEFILNDTPKTITVKKASYDDLNNMFSLETEIETH